MDLPRIGDDLVVFEVIRADPRRAELLDDLAVRDGGPQGLGGPAVDNQLHDGVICWYADLR